MLKWETVTFLFHSETNWLIEIVCLIQTKGDPKWIQTVPTWDRSPWLETDRGYPALINKEGPRLITSHFPIHLFSKSFFSSKAKVSVQWLRFSLTKHSFNLFYLTSPGVLAEMWRWDYHAIGDADVSPPQTIWDRVQGCGPAHSDPGQL